MTLVIGYTNQEERVHISDANPKEKYYCLSKHLLIPKKGSIKVHHFSHKHLSDAENCDCTYFKHDNKTFWHQMWQDRYPKDQLEITMDLDGKRHRADIFDGERVIEIQHSNLSPDEIKEREDFYVDMIWIIDCTFQTAYRPFGNMNFCKGLFIGRVDSFWRRATKPVYLDFEGFIFEVDMKTIHTGPCIKGTFLTTKEFCEKRLYLNNVKYTEDEKERMKDFGKYKNVDSFDRNMASYLKKWEPQKDTVYYIGKKYNGYTYEKLACVLVSEHFYRDLLFDEISMNLDHLRFIRDLVRGSKKYNWWCKKCSISKQCPKCNNRFEYTIIKPRVYQPLQIAEGESAVEECSYCQNVVSK